MKSRVPGVIVTVIGVAMFFMGIDGFAHRGPISKVYSKITMYSFMLWLPVVIIGIILIAIKKPKVKNN